MAELVDMAEDVKMADWASSMPLFPGTFQKQIFHVKTADHVKTAEAETEFRRDRASPTPLFPAASFNP